MRSVFLQVSTVMVTETAKTALMNKTARLLLVQETSFCAPREDPEEFLDAFSVHHCVMARRTVRIQRMRKQLVVSLQFLFLLKQIVTHVCCICYAASSHERMKGMSQQGTRIRKTSWYPVSGPRSERNKEWTGSCLMRTNPYANICESWRSEDVKCCRVINKGPHVEKSNQIIKFTVISHLLVCSGAFLFKRILIYLFIRLFQTRTVSTFDILLHFFCLHLKIARFKCWTWMQSSKSWNLIKDLLGVCYFGHMTNHPTKLIPLFFLLFFLYYNFKIVWLNVIWIEI